ncbi:hypothetical protein [Rhizobium leucaenae]|uniref:DUF4440 domain-containing protein n=1 Tax=Rhizobium leucaenae TaxID=29450 RepID=A0A7W6ZR24_9HYPH|nr:hypothetical protein [Rhizobium leucaenae]MBB4566680.1 hypothetical protein [Rhizobium leucaenae]MBB6301425.1 hypothetical protein [Rhizobium leucaenae]
MSKSPSLFERAKVEIIDLHRCFSNWYNSDDPDPADFSRFEKVLGEGFHIVTPDDGRIIERDSIISHVRANHSCFHGDFIIEIEDIKPGWEAAGIIVVTYIEAQCRAGAWSRRRASALFTENSSMPNGVEWRHLHETWLQAPEAKQANH